MCWCPRWPYRAPWPTGWLSTADRRVLPALGAAGPPSRGHGAPSLQELETGPRLLPAPGTPKSGAPRLLRVTRVAACHHVASAPCGSSLSHQGTSLDQRSPPDAVRPRPNLVISAKTLFPNEAELTGRRAQDSTRVGQEASPEGLGRVSTHWPEEAHGPGRRPEAGSPQTLGLPKRGRGHAGTADGPGGAAAPGCPWMTVVPCTSGPPHRCHTLCSELRAGAQEGCPSSADTPSLPHARDTRRAPLSACTRRSSANLSASPAAAAGAAT